jgi:hypothetical protein
MYIHIDEEGADIMLDLIGAIVGMSAVGVNLVLITHAVSGTLVQRLSLGAMVGAWVGLASGLGAAGKLAFAPDNPVPVLGVLAALPLLLVAALALLSPKARAALLALPLPLLIGVNSMRVLGILFLFLAANGRLSGPFPYAAGLGDIITGVLAIPLALNIARSGQVSARAIRRWNVFGALDLVVALGLGVTSAVGSPLQLIHGGVGSQAMQYLPFCLVPTVLVPLYLISHAIVAAKLAAAGRRPAAVLSQA